MRTGTRFIGIAIMLAGSVIYAIDMVLTPRQPYYVYENETRRSVFRIELLLWPHSSPEFNPLVPVEFDIIIFGALLALLAIFATKWAQSKKARSE